jgi:hypothetical protein
MKRTILAFLGIAALALLQACSLTPAEQAHALSKTYTFSANSTADLMEDGFVPADIKPCVKAADRAAFGYVKQTNLAAQEWLKAGSEEQTVLEQVVNNLIALAQGSMADISHIIATKECAK